MLGVVFEKNPFLETVPTSFTDRFSTNNFQSCGSLNFWDFINIHVSQQILETSVFSFSRVLKRHYFIP
jgi:hypothetical protein